MEEKIVYQAIRKSDNVIVSWVETEFGLLPRVLGERPPGVPERLDRSVQWNIFDFYERVYPVQTRE